MSGQRQVKYTRPATRNEDAGVVSGAWAPRAGSVTDSPAAFVLLGRDEEESGRAISVREYNFDSDTLLDTIHAIEMEDGRPLQLAVHPSGDGVLCSFANSCKFFEINPKGLWKLRASERELPLLQGIGIQNCIRFSLDGSMLATGGKDGYLRVFAWPTCQLILDEPHAHRSIQDIDISMDSAYLASTAEDSACRVWEISKGESIAQLQREKDEKFGYCRFSRDGAQAFLFVSITKGERGYIGVWNMVDWSKLGSKMLADAPIASLDVSRDGKSLGLGTTEGDLVVVLVRKMEATQLIGSAHSAPVTGLEFSKHGRSLLSFGADATARISRLKKSEWKEWHLYLVLLGMIALSALLFLAFFESSLSDDFWKFPMGRAQPARPPPEAIWSHPTYQEPETYGL
ncbi:hypothetical protein M758_4G061700 [Ceratodon purpureus]|uniref:Uncharacterized protein n=1 Tax=Ceratodon purpureus TaxID=3225 RepID=A0A8T0I760_CERPU|nr:hypothetical protein KC19_4G057000 [Ceratodon purpureus]KAG0618409.1 hypothetical protein M758_4G061700 [Ceratodon purpureus]